MMLAPSTVAAAASALGGVIDENEARLDVTGSFDAAAVAEWSVIIADASSLGLTIETFDAFQEPTASLKVGSARVSVRKSPTASTLYFFSVSGFRRALLNDDVIAAARQILIAEDAASFKTLAFTVEPWITLVADDERPWEQQPPSPLDFVRDKGAGVVPSSIANAILASDIPGDSAAFSAWRDVALTKIRNSLATDVWRRDGKIVLGIDGPRSVEVVIDDHEDPLLFPLANEVAKWVYQGSDAESKLVLFTAELARDWPQAEGWGVGFARVAPVALAAAKRAHRNSLVERSTETLKSLGELRKSLGEDIGRTVQLTGELVSSSWRDFAIAIAALVARLTVLSSAQVGKNVGAALIVSVAGFLALTYLVRVVSNWRFNVNLRSVRATWRTQLYGYLTDEEYAADAKTPIDRVNRIYFWTALLLGLAYAVVIGLVLAFGLFGVGSTPSAPTTGSVGGSAASSSKTVKGKVKHQPPGKPTSQP